MVGKVFLIGAGPGDPGLITVRGQRALAAADVVLYDALAHPALLAHARPGAELRSVGKRYGEESFSQEAINRELVTLAQAGRVVARLKGGDPLLFARGAEEAETLARAGIAFEIIPGVPSPTAAAAYAGISLTHRDLSSSVAFITGTESPGKERTAHDWSKLATATQTLCVIMGMKRLGEIAQALVENGRAPDTPAAVVQWGTWPRQRVIAGTLRDIAAKADEAGVANPAVVVIGEVARLREGMRWFDNRPLFGKRILLPRPLHQSVRTAEAVRDRGAEPVVEPLIEIAPPPDPAAFARAMEHLGDYDVVAFTSANAVDRVFGHLRDHKRDARAFGRARIAAIGPGTAASIAAESVYVDIVAEEFRGEGLAEAIVHALATRSEKTPARVLLPRAKVARSALPDALRSAGIETTVVAAYETRPVPRERSSALVKQIAKGDVDVVLLTSSSTASELCNAIESVGGRVADALASTVVASIGPITTETAKSRGLRVDVTASSYTVEGLLDALEGHFAARG